MKAYIHIPINIYELCIMPEKLLSNFILGRAQSKDLSNELASHERLSHYIVLHSRGTCEQTIDSLAFIIIYNNWPSATANFD